jgi:hypothetical protein
MKSPDVISQASRHSRRTRCFSRVIGIFSPERPDRPAEVVRVGAEKGSRLMHVPILGKPVTPPDFAGILMPVCTIVPFYKSGVDRAAARRGLQSLLKILSATIDDSLADSHYSAMAAVLMDSGIQQSRQWTASRFGATSDTMFAVTGIRFPVDFQDGIPVRFVFVAGDQAHQAASRSAMEIPHHTMNVLPGTLPGNHGDNQFVLGVEGNMVPLITNALFAGHAMLFFFPNKSPLLVKLNFLGFGGKKRPTRRGVSGHALQPSRQSGWRCFWKHPLSDRFGVPRTPRGCAPRWQGLFRGEVLRCKAVSPCARRSGPCNLSSRFGEWSFSCCSNRKRRDFPGPVDRTFCTRNSGSTSVPAVSLADLLMYNSKRIRRLAR